MLDGQRIGQTVLEARIGEPIMMSEGAGRPDRRHVNTDEALQGAGERPQKRTTEEAKIGGAFGALGAGAPGVVDEGMDGPSADLLRNRSTSDITVLQARAPRQCRGEGQRELRRKNRRKCKWTGRMMSRSFVLATGELCPQHRWVDMRRFVISLCLDPGARDERQQMKMPRISGPRLRREAKMVSCKLCQLCGHRICIPRGHRHQGHVFQDSGGGN
mmetsp:Transcript_41196/g.94758  ORF Transcript_41196/g.94758 Transcript_41196/m.94758 type:complete len:216 (+) Transcript_41196:158-805(+)